MISSFTVLSPRGDVLIHRDFKGDVSRAESLVFSQKVVAAREADSAPPVQSFGRCHFLHVVRDGIVYVAATKINVNAILVLTAIGKFVDILKSYLGTTPFTEYTVRSNFVLIYELLDEVFDFGVPQVLEIDVLKKYITQGGTKIDRIPEKDLRSLTIQATGATSWRAEGIKYRKNEVYLDVIENVNVLVSQTGHTLTADVQGTVVVKCLLSGTPECKFGLNDKLTLSGGSGHSQRGLTSSAARGITMDDVRFHQCVKMSRFDTDRVISFIPPDGVFELMSYRVTENIHLPFKILPSIHERSRTRLEYFVKIKSTFPSAGFATNVVVKLPCPRNAARATVSPTSVGKAKFEAAQEAIIWRIRRFPGITEYTLVADVELAATTVESRWARPPVTVDFLVPMFTSSGLCVRFLRVFEKSNYTPIKWIRYITKAGSYQYRW